MGHRANYVIIADGEIRLFESRWGAASIVADLLAGPEHMLVDIDPGEPRTPPPRDDPRAVLMWRGPDPTGALMSDLWCEGAALVDLDRKVLLAFQWVEDRPTFVAGLAGLVAAWPGWEVRWAFDGVGDIAGYIGRDRATIRHPDTGADPDEFRTPFLTAEEMGSYLFDVGNDHDLYRFVFSVRGHDGSLLLYPTVCEISELRPDRTFREHLPPGFLRLDCSDVPRAGVHLDYRTRTAGVWTIDSMKGFLDGVRAEWPGWRWVLWGADLHRQVAACDGRLRVPDLAASG